MKHNWEYKTLGSVCIPKKEILRASLKFGKEDTIEYIDISSINKDSGKATTTTYTFADAPSRAQQVVNDDDVLVSLVRPNLKNIALIQDNRDNLVGSSGFCVLRSRVLIQRFIYYIVNSDSFTNKLVLKCAGAAYPAVREQDVKDIIIPVPPMEVQKLIVAELDKINGVIADCRELLLKLDTLAKSLFYDYFGDPVTNPKGWHTLPLKKLSTLITNGTTPKGGQAVYVDSGITFFRSQNVWRNRIIYDDIVYLDESTNAAMKGSMLKHNDILITKTGRINTENSSLGRSALFTGEDDTANINGHVYLVRLDGSIEPRFVLSILLTESYRDLIRKVCVGAIDKRQLNLTHIQQFPIILPPLKIQKNYVKSIEAIEKQKATVEETIKKMQTLLDSRMDYWFN